MKIIKILFFIKGCNPTSKEKIDILKLETNGVKIVCRNSKVVSSSDSVEICDGVAGVIPELYKHFPTVGEVLEKFNQSKKQQLEKLMKEDSKSIIIPSDDDDDDDNDDHDDDNDDWVENKESDAK